MKKIEWKAHGSDVEHSIPSAAKVAFTGEHGQVVVGFDGDGRGAGKEQAE